MASRTTIPPFLAGTIEAVSRALGDLYTGTEVNQLLIDSGLPLPIADGTKWRRIDASLRTQQNRQGDGRPLVALVNEAMKPDRTLAHRAEAATTRDSLNQVLSLSGLVVRADGIVARTTRTTTDTEAAQRSTRLRAFLQERGAHQEVLRHCRPELLREDHYEAVFEAIKGLVTRLKRLSGLGLDGSPLVQQALGGKEPILRLNALETQTQRNEQRGTALLAEGLVAAFRNPSAHETRVEWALSEHDALDVLGTVSLVHRRLDTMTVHRSG